MPYSRRNGVANGRRSGADDIASDVRDQVDGHGENAVVYDLELLGTVVDSDRAAVAWVGVSPSADGLVARLARAFVPEYELFDVSAFEPLDSEKEWPGDNPGQELVGSDQAELLTSIESRFGFHPGRWVNEGMVDAESPDNKKASA